MEMVEARQVESEEEWAQAEEGVMAQVEAEGVEGLMVEEGEVGAEDEAREEDLDLYLNDHDRSNYA